MSPVAPPTRPDKKRSRTPAIVALSIAIFLLFAVIFSQATFNLTFLQPDTSEETLIFAALSAFIFLLFVALTFVLLRTLLRLYAERKTGVMGSKLRSRMVMGALLLSLGPVIFLFLFSYGLINRSIEKWFSRPVEDVQYRTGVVASLLTDYAADNARVEAERIAATPAAKKSFETGNFTPGHGRVPPQRSQPAGRIRLRPRRRPRGSQLPCSRRRGRCFAITCPRKKRLRTSPSPSTFWERPTCWAGRW